MSDYWSLEDVSWGTQARPRIVADWNLQLPKGRLTAVVGPNGSGKTCVLNLLAGHETPRKGRVLCLDEDTAKWREPEWARAVAHLSAAPDANVSLCVQDVLLAAEFTLEGRWPRVGALPKPEALRLLVDWEVLGERTTAEFLRQRFSTLSDGERQLVTLIRVISQGSPALVLDEPMAFLDIRHRLLVQRTLRGLANEGMTILFSLHELESDFSWVDDLLIVHRGRLVSQGDPESVLTDQLVEDVWGVRWHVSKRYRRPGLVEELPRTGIEPARTLPSGGF